MKPIPVCSYRFPRVVMKKYTSHYARRTGAAAVDRETGYDVAVAGSPYTKRIKFLINKKVCVVPADAGATSCRHFRMVSCLQVR